MTKLLREAYAAASKLPKKEQDAFARFMLEELASERKWAKAFVNSQEQLATLAKRALRDFEQAKTKPIDN